MEDTMVQLDRRIPDFALVTALLLCAAPIPAAAAEAAWQGIGPQGGLVTALAPDPTPRSHTVYAGTTAGVFKSTDGGASWTPSTSGVTDPRITSLALDSLTPSTLYAGTRGAGILWSSDGGASWTPVNTGVPLVNGFQPVTALAVVPGFPPTVFAVTGGALLRSADGGQSWRQVVLPAPARGALAVEPGADNRVYVGTDAGLYQSLDEGLTFQPTPLRQPVTALAFRSGDLGSIYAGTGGGIFKSTDFGNSWQLAGPQLTGRNVLSLAADPLVPDNLFAAATVPGSSNRGAVFRSEDDGATWQRAAAGITAGRTLTLAVTVASTNRITLYAGTDLGGVFTSTNRARRWQPADQGLWMPVSKVALDSGQPGVLYAGGQGLDPNNQAFGDPAVDFGLWKTSDGGAGWQRILALGGDCHALAVDPQRPAFVYAGGPSQLWRSRDRGADWTPVLADATSGHFTLGPLVVDPRHPRTLYASDGEAVVKSADAGRSWTTSQVGCVLPLAFALDPTDSSTLYLGGDVADPKCVLPPISRQAGGLWKSTDASASWTPLPLPRISGFVIARDLAFDPTDPTRLYAALFDRGLFLSQDGGATWIEVGQLPSASALALDPTAPGTIYADALVSTDGGLHFTSTAPGLPPFEVHQLLLDPRPPKTLYAATAGGLFRLRLAP
jgi:photosystem II stability/assembly factor-like uncharacterized protein